MVQNISSKKYLYSFIITVIIFGTAIYLSNYFGQKKLAEIRSIQDKIAIDILSSETQFSLLEDSLCKDVGVGSLSTELGNLENKLTYTENERGANDSEVQTLKRYYSLLEIKDYLLMNRISEKCKKTPLSIIYFYSTDDSCPDCQREGYVLTRLRETYPELRIYSFDYNLDVSAVKTLISIKKVKNQLPAIVIKDRAYYGFQSIEDLEKAIPELQILKAQTASSTTATSTKK
ncbi:MAG TPA: thioredoxin family protein [Candidatus Paceibacterota bacterium]